VTFASFIPFALFVEFEFFQRKELSALAAELPVNIHRDKVTRVVK
jgi:hypothetical protein